MLPKERATPVRVRTLTIIPAPARTAAIIPQLTRDL